MKVLSFDVGIKNLAYCIIEKKNDDFVIHDWDVINIADNVQNCMFKLKNNNLCCQNAKFCYNDGQNNFFLCNKHANQDIFALNKKSQNICCKCQNIGNYQFIYDTNNFFCQEHSELFKKEFTKPKKISFKKTQCNKQPIFELSSNLFSKLDSNKNFLLVDEVLIENQPSIRNPTMKTISMLLYSYFMIKGIFNNVITNVKFISPSNKLKINKNITEIFLNGNKDKKKYTITKKLGILYCSALITDENKTKLLTHKKKDDLCDSFLQGFQYIFSPIPEIFVNKLSNIAIELNNN
jgi:hypothetical protein